MVKNPPAVQEIWVLSLGWEDPGEGNGYPLKYSYLENSTTDNPGELHPWGRKKSDTTE